MKLTDKRHPRQKRRQGATKTRGRGGAKTGIKLKQSTTSTPKISIPTEDDTKTGTRTPASLVEGDQFYKELVDAVFDGVLIHQDGIVKAVNQSLAVMFGYTIREMIGRPLLDFIPPESREFIASQIRARIESCYEYSGLRKDGTRIPVEVSAKNFIYQGRPARIIALRDISGRKLLEEALRRGEENFRSFVETTRDWIWATDRDVRISYSNPALTAILGYQPGELLGRNFLELMHEEERRHIEQRLPEWIADKTGWSDLILRWRHKDGTYRYLESTAVPVLEATGELAGYRGTNRDVTERKLAEDALRESEARYRELYDDAPVGYHEIDVQGRITRVNRSELSILGYSAEEMLGRYVWEFVSEPDVSRQAVADKIAERIPLKAFERTLVRKDGTSIPVLLQECYLRDESGRVIGIRTTMQDISDRKRAEETLKQLTIKEERQKAAQKMLLVLMHEIYNPLTAVLGNAALLKSENLSPAVRECVRDIEISTQRIDSVLRMLIKLDLSDPVIITGAGPPSSSENS